MKQFLQHASADDRFNIARLNAAKNIKRRLTVLMNIANGVDNDIGIN
jgi:hypothetical protein